MSQTTRNPKAFTPKRIRRGIKLDRIQASDFLNYELMYACEQCSFFSPENRECMMAFPSEPHLQANQIKCFETTGHMAFCRFLEID